MGIRSGFFVFLRPSCYGSKQRTGRPGTREKEIGFERYQSFQKRDAHALRFGSMNPISRFWGRGSMGESSKGSNPALYLGRKLPADPHGWG